MQRLASQPLGHGITVAVFSILTLGIMLRVSALQDTAGSAMRYADVPDAVVAQTASAGGRDVSDTLTPYAAIVASSERVEVVRAADDALQGRASVTVPMQVTQYRQERDAVIVSLRPIATPGIIWHRIGGTVRVLADGRRVIVARAE